MDLCIHRERNTTKAVKWSLFSKNKINADLLNEIYRVTNKYGMYCPTVNANEFKWSDDDRYVIVQVVGGDIFLSWGTTPGERKHLKIKNLDQQIKNISAFLYAQKP